MPIEIPDLRTNALHVAITQLEQRVEQLERALQLSGGKPILPPS